MFRPSMRAGFGGRSKRILHAAVLMAGTVAVFAETRGFREVEPALLLQKTPKLEPGAGAEAVFWEIRLTEGSNLHLEHYLRLKLFTEQGRDQHSSIEIPSTSDVKISGIAGRTIKPDGSIVPLDPTTIFERTIVMSGRRKIKVHSFVMPATSPGAVIEYRWSEERNNDSLHYTKLELQRDIPVWKIGYTIQPLKTEELALQYRAFHAPSVQFRKVSRNTYSLDVENVLPYRAEPFAPPELNIRPWILLNYASRFTQVAQLEMKIQLEADFRQRTKPNNDIRRLAAELTAGAATGEEKLKRLADYCRTKIRNVRYETGPAAAGLKAQAAKNKDAAGVLKTKIASGDQINTLFASLAQAGGFDAHRAMLNDRSVYLGPGSGDDYFLSAGNIAVKVDGRWHFYDPATRDVQPGMLRWQEEGVYANIALPGTTVRQVTPWSPPAASKANRRAIIRLTPDGNAEADISMTYSGHFNTDLKTLFSGLTPDEVSEEIKDRELTRLTGSRLENIKVDNLVDPEKPLTVSFRAIVPGYAQRAGSRLMLPAGFFQRGAKPRFSGSERKFPVYFPYPWAEEDYVQIVIPDGFEIDALDQPAGIELTNVGAYDADVTTSSVSGQKNLIYTRRFDFGRDGVIVYRPELYSLVKKIFDQIQRLDEHVVSIRRKRPEAPK